ncbi:MAG: hypothetical protein KF758_14235 [Anaerolineales bacterium]|nr:hypothetical protein [Anaerolineales bacterium]MBX3038066.1 hypothetical protein [Anaerolineales bacterium]
MFLSNTEKKILLECEDDYVSLWNAMKLINRNLPTDAPIPEWIISETLNSLYNLLSKKLITAGKLESKSKDKKNQFIDLQLSPDEIISLIKEAKEEFNFSPLNYGFVCWFHITKTGRESILNI